MASEVTVSPSSGHAPFPTQGGVGDPVSGAGFDAIEYRRFWSRAYVEGVLEASGWKVREASTPGMKVDVDAQFAPALVQGDAVTDQGLYYVAPHSAKATVDIEAANSTNPRIDRIVLQVRDGEHDGTGQYDARVRVVKGNPTVGATLNNQAGAVDVPGTALHLADVLVAAGATSILNASIRDYRTYAQKDAVVGDVRFSSASSPGDGWLPADRRTLNRKQHWRLFAATGIVHGAGDGTNTFNVIDLADRVAVGAGSSFELGDTGGAATVTLTEAQLPAHDHDLRSSSVNDGILSDHSGSGQHVRSGGSNPTSAATETAGGNQPHENMPPYTGCSVYVFTGSVVG